MPPLPGTLDASTVDLIEASERRRNDLVEFQIPRLRDCKGPLVLQQRLAAELRDDLDRLGRDIEALDVLVDDQKGEKNRRELRGIVEELKGSLVSLRKDTRAALLASKKTIDSQSLSQRDELLASGAVNEKRGKDSNEKITDDALMKANDDVTDALRRTVALMQGELEKSVLSTQMLDRSTATLRAASTQHDTLSAVMSTSKQLITALEKSDWLDRIILLAAFAFFILVVLFILKQRFVDRGIRIALWWTRFLPDFGGGDEALMRDLEKGVQGSGSVEAVLAATATVSSVLASMSRAVDPSKGVEAEEAEEPSVVSTEISETLAATLVPPEADASSSINGDGSVTSASEVPERTVDPVIAVHEEL